MYQKPPYIKQGQEMFIFNIQDHICEYGETNNEEENIEIEREFQNILIKKSNIKNNKRDCRIYLVPIKNMQQ